MTDADPALLAQLELLKRKFAGSLPARLDKIDAALDACAAAPADRQSLADLCAAFHSLAGSAGIFGFDTLGEQARRAEPQVLDCMDNAGTPVPLAQLRALAAAWRGNH